MSASIPVQIYNIKADGGHLDPTSTDLSEPRSFENVIAFLTSRLPQSLPILRAVQLGSKDEGAILITTTLPPASRKEPVEKGPESMKPESVWTMAYVNRANHPGTELWAFSSLEMWPLIDGYEEISQKPYMNPWQLFLPFPNDVCQLAIRQFVAVLSQIPGKNRDGQQSILEQGEYPDSPCIKAGNIHTRIASLLTQTSVILKNSPPYGKYFFRTGHNTTTSSSLSDGGSVNLPPGFQWDLITPSDYADVMEQNQLIRSTSTLDKLKGVAIRQVDSLNAEASSKLAAFAFAGEDGSIRTLHVDPSFRRMGLAKAAVQRVLSLGFCNPPKEGPFAASETIQTKYEGTYPLAFCGVLESNEGSIRTFKAIGGNWTWDVFWLWLDLDEARKTYAS